MAFVLLVIVFIAIRHVVNIIVATWVAEKAKKAPVKIRQVSILTTGPDQKDRITDYMDVVAYAHTPDDMFTLLHNDGVMTMIPFREIRSIESRVEGEQKS
jgi:hypothetical protein